MSQEVIRLLFLDLLLEHLLTRALSALLRFKNWLSITISSRYSSLLGLFSPLLVVEATNVCSVLMMVLAAAEGNTNHPSLGCWSEIEDDSLKWRLVEWIDSSLASKLSSRVIAGYWTAE